MDIPNGLKIDTQMSSCYTSFDFLKLSQADSDLQASWSGWGSRHGKL